MAIKVGCPPDFVYKHSNFGRILGKKSVLDPIIQFSIYQVKKVVIVPQLCGMYHTKLPLSDVDPNTICDK